MLMGWKIKLLWVATVLVISFGVLFSLKYTSTSRPVPKIRISVSSHLSQVGRYNYLRLWPELESSSLIILGINEYLDTSEQWFLWKGFIEEAKERGNSYSKIFMEDSLYKTLKPEKSSVISGKREILKNKVLESRFRTDELSVLIVPSSLGLEWKKELNSIEGLEFLGVWPLAESRERLYQLPYPCVEQGKSKKEAGLFNIGCEIRSRSISLFRKIKRKRKKIRGNDRWFYVTDHVSKGRYNIYLLAL